MQIRNQAKNLIKRTHSMKYTIEAALPVAEAPRKFKSLRWPTIPVVPVLERHLPLFITIWANCWIVWRGSLPFSPSKALGNGSLRRWALAGVDESQGLPICLSRKFKRRKRSYWSLCPLSNSSDMRLPARKCQWVVNWISNCFDRLLEQETSLEVWRCS